MNTFKRLTNKPKMALYSCILFQMSRCQIARWHNIDRDIGADSKGLS